MDERLFILFHYVISGKRADEPFEVVIIALGHLQRQAVAYDLPTY